ncbi:ABC transporter substrate-binding protein [Ligilactobacillus equi]
MLIYDDVVTKNVTEYLQLQLETNLPGLTVELNNIPKATAIQRYMDGEFDFGLLGWGADYADSTTFLNLLTVDGSGNYGKWDNQEFNNLMNAEKTTNVNNESKRWDDLVKAANVVNDTAVISPLYQPTLATMVKSKVQNVGYDNFGHFIFWDMSVK